MSVRKKALKLQSRLENLHNMRASIRNFFKRSRLDEDVANLVVLSIDEAVANIIEHGYRLSPKGTIDISIELTTAKIAIKILDCSQQFNPKSAVTNAHNAINTKKQRGLGLIIIHRCMDDILYRFTEDNKNELVMIKYLKRNRE